MPNQIPGKGNYNFIDLFAGAGGLSEGFIQAGFNPIAHVEMNAFAAQTLITRSAYYYLKQKGFMTFLKVSRKFCLQLPLYKTPCQTFMV